MVQEAVKRRDGAAQLGVVALRAAARAVGLDVGEVRRFVSPPRT
jgi:hypothetical protein